MKALKFLDNVTGCSLIFDDDRRVAYAYLLGADGAIISDVWLYNVASTPIEPEWKDRDKSPYLNPKEFVKNEKIKPVEHASEIKVVWFHDGNKKLKRVELFLYDVLIAVIATGVRPGWSKFALKNGPLAKVLSELETLS